MKREFAVAAALFAVFAAAPAAWAADDDDLLSRELEKISGKTEKTDRKEKPAETPKKKADSAKRPETKEVPPAAKKEGNPGKRKPEATPAPTSKKPAPESKPAPPPPAPSEEKSSALTSFALRYGTVGDGWSASGLLEIPLSDSFDLALRGYYHSFQYEYTARVQRYRTYHYWYGSYRSYYYTNEKRTAEFDHYGGAGYAMWRPTRGCFLDLFAGAGVCYEDGDLVDRDVVDGGFGVVFRLGATAWLGPLSVTGEYLINPDSKELVGDVGLHLSENFSLHVYVDQIDFDDFDLRDDTVFGGGMTFSF